MQQINDKNKVLGIGSTFPEFKVHAIQDSEFVEIDEKILKG